jgi:hypothetical protein
VVRPVNQCRTEIFRLPGELRRGPGVRVVAVAGHRDIDEVSRRGILPDLGVDLRQIDPLSIQRPTRSSPASTTFGRAIGCGHAIAVRSTRSWRKADSNPRSHSHESFCRGAAEGGSRNEWLGSHFKLWSSREMAIGCAPSPRPVQGETEISNLVCHESLIREWADLKRAACHSISSDRANAAVHHPARSINP